MGVAVLHPQDCLKHPLAHMKYPRNPNASPNKPKPNRTRRSPPRHQSTRSSPPPQAPPLPSVKKTVPLRILKRGEEIPQTKVDLVVKKTDLVVVKTDLVVEKTDLVVEKSDLGTTKRIGPDPVTIRIPNRKPKTVPFYAGPVTMSSPPPSDVPLPAFFTNNIAATNNLMKMLRIDTA